MLLLTSLRVREGRSDLAVPTVEAAVRATPQDTALLLLLADLYLKTGHYEAATARATDALTQTPTLTPARRITSA